MKELLSPNNKTVAKWVKIGCLAVAAIGLLCVGYFYTVFDTKVSGDPLGLQDMKLVGVRMNGIQTGISLVVFAAIVAAIEYSRGYRRRTSDTSS